MTNEDRDLIVKLWDSGLPATSIINLLPYKKVEIKQEIANLRLQGVLKGRSGKTQQKTYAKMLQAFNDGITSPYEIADMLGLEVNTVSKALWEMGCKRKRPKHNYNKKKLCDKTAQILLEIERGDKPLTEIAKKYGVSKQRVHALKKKHL